MDFENIIGIIGLIVYLIYSFNKGRKKLREERRQKPEPQPVSQEENPSSPTSLDDMMKKFFDEMEGKQPPAEKKKTVEERRPLIREEIKPIRELVNEGEDLEEIPVEDDERQSLETVESDFDLKNISYGASQPFAIEASVILPPPVEQETEDTKQDFNARNAVIYAAILNRPYQ